MKIRRRSHPTTPAPRTTPRDPRNPRNKTGERMSRDGRLGPLYSHRNYRYDEPRIDPALLRPGRLLCRVHITPLDLETAAKVNDEIKKETTTR